MSLLALSYSKQRHFCRLLSFCPCAGPGAAARGPRGKHNWQVASKHSVQGRAFTARLRARSLAEFCVIQGTLQHAPLRVSCPLVVQQERCWQALQQHETGASLLATPEQSAAGCRSRKLSACAETGSRPKQLLLREDARWNRCASSSSSRRSSRLLLGARAVMPRRLMPWTELRGRALGKKAQGERWSPFLPALDGARASLLNKLPYAVVLMISSCAPCAGLRTSLTFRAQSSCKFSSTPAAVAARRRRGAHPTSALNLPAVKRASSRRETLATEHRGLFQLLRTNTVSSRRPA